MKIAEELKRLNLGFNKKEWLRKHLKKKARCGRCGSIVCKHMRMRQDNKKMSFNLRKMFSCTKKKHGRHKTGAEI